MGFFGNTPLAEVRKMIKDNGDQLDHTLAALRLSGLANAVSVKHKETLSGIWAPFPDICPLLSITNAQNYTYWSDKKMYAAMMANDDEALLTQKKQAKEILFGKIADENGEIYDKDVLTIVFAKRFTGFKRPDLLLHDMQRFHRLVTNRERPIQIVWAGKPYPMDYASIGVFDKIVNISKQYPNCSTLTGYELRLSKLLKGGADLWLNTPRLTHEASGTSGMTAAMNGAVNASLPDGWFPEFANDRINCFLIPPCDPSLPEHSQDEADAASLYDLLENDILPMYYEYPDRWLSIMKNSMSDIITHFGSNRLADEYYRKLYSRKVMEM
jgi:starch phosphorylase